jgi:hypothetical protein
MAPKTGRPTKLTAALARAITDAVRLGLPLAVACARAGVGVATVSEWVARGEGRDPDRRPTKAYADFAAALRKARADDQARRIDRIEQAARGGAVVQRATHTKPDGTTTVTEKYAEPQWTADAWHLERSDPAHWGRRDRHEVTGRDGGPVELVVKVLGPGLSMDDL